MNTASDIFHYFGARYRIKLIFNSRARSGNSLLAFHHPMAVKKMTRFPFQITSLTKNTQKAGAGVAAALSVQVASGVMMRCVRICKGIKMVFANAARLPVETARREGRGNLIPPIFSGWLGPHPQMNDK